jgi:hypothetical protein
MRRIKISQCLALKSGMPSSVPSQKEMIVIENSARLVLTNALVFTDFQRATFHLYEKSANRTSGTP